MAKLRAKKDLYLSFDEWNVWYHSPRLDKKLDPLDQVPAGSRTFYNVEDAMLVGGMLITLLNHADRVKIACLARWSMSSSDHDPGRRGAYGRPLLSFLHASAFGRGTASSRWSRLQHDTSSSRRAWLVTAAVWNEEGSELTVSSYNRGLENSRPTWPSRDSRG
jgi:alpha-N-arabinofuranosidase